MKLLLALALWGAVASPVTTARIVGGYNCPVHKVPWQVYVTTGHSFCGGSLINERWVLSAAHCKGRNDTLVTRLGETDRTRLEGTEQNIKADLLIPHPNYNPLTIDNDIMLIKLAQPARFNKYVGPIPLPSSCPAAGTQCLVSGWGNVLSDGVAVPRKLRCLRLPIVPEAQCKKTYPSEYTSNMVCAGFTEGGKSACHGDSGEPLVCNGQLQGIVSWGYGCARKDHPTVYTKVCNYLPWINHMISSN